MRGLIWAIALGIVVGMLVLMPAMTTDTYAHDFKAQPAPRAIHSGPQEVAAHLRVPGIHLDIVRPSIARTHHRAPLIWVDPIPYRTHGRGYMHNMPNIMQRQEIWISKRFGGSPPAPLVVRRFGDSHFSYSRVYRQRE